MDEKQPPGSEDAKNFLHRCRGSCASSSEDPGSEKTFPGREDPVQL